MHKKREELYVFVGAMRDVKVIHTLKSNGVGVEGGGVVGKDGKWKVCV